MTEFLSFFSISYNGAHESAAKWNKPKKRYEFAHIMYCKTMIF